MIAVNDDWGPKDTIDELERRREVPTRPELPTLPDNRSTAPEVVSAPLTEIRARELFEQWSAPVLLMLKELHAVVLGSRTQDGEPIGGIPKAFHDVNKNLAAILATLVTISDDQLELRQLATTKIAALGERVAVVEAESTLHGAAVEKLEETVGLSRNGHIPGGFNDE